ncbi:hypothetical protein [uncultured Hymenobacter sp.]|uniref:hypothetical protein n=1 Tax=uncultured Hymenobacter sp. TaxID=170016 RepID=UPI0035CB6884
MAITLESFSRLPVPEQFYLVLRHGNFQALRFEETYAVTHYLLYNFCADLYYSGQTDLPERVQVLVFDDYLR